MFFLEIRQVSLCFVTWVPRGHKVLPASSKQKVLLIVQVAFEHLKHGLFTLCVSLVFLLSLFRFVLLQIPHIPQSSEKVGVFFTFWTQQKQVIFFFFLPHLRDIQRKTLMYYYSLYFFFSTFFASMNIIFLCCTFSVHVPIENAPGPLLDCPIAGACFASWGGVLGMIFASVWWSICMVTC